MPPSSLINNLSSEEKIVMAAIARVPKSNEMRIFHSRDVKRKKSCWDIDVDRVLSDLQDLGLVHHQGSGDDWVVTRGGKIIEHDIESKVLSNENPGITILKRGRR